jgi:asparagine synthase (glutamine-hydrolysing)
MCGIVGVISFDHCATRVGAPEVISMRDTMQHRGPDGAGVWVAGNGRVGLGHRRLSIIDLSATADQPMSNEDGSLRVVFNGEIYNHAALRKELESLGGHKWKSDHSDTEVILHSFEQWGIDCLHKFRGMFAIALWDARRRELWLVRDRIGIKPLYYSIHHGRLTFASEIKALLEDPQQEREVDEQAFYHYLSFLTTPAPQTLLRGIRKLAGGTWLRVRLDGATEERRYWDAWDSVEPLTGKPDDEIADRILTELRTAVQLRKLSDVPVGVFLSGGIDSSVNAALFSEGETRPVRTFSIGYDGNYQSYPNELHQARRMAEHVRADHHDCILKQQDLIDFLPEMIRLQDEPIADPVCVPVYYLSKLARANGVIVCQVGEGSDELFWGYRYWRASLRLQQMAGLPVPKAMRRVALKALASLGHDEAMPYEWLRRDIAGQPIFWGGAEAFSDTHKQRLLSHDLRRRLSGISSWEALQPIRARFEERAWEKSDLAWMTYLDLNLRLPELLLMRVDKMSMGVSLEARVPFLDHKFVELAMGIPQAVKTRGGTLKAILKRSVRKLVPREVLERPKQGFGVPIDEWFRDELGKFTREQVKSFCRKTDFFNPDAAARLLQSDSGKRAWYLLNFALWWEHYVAAAPKRRSIATAV